MMGRFAAVSLMISLAVCGAAARAQQAGQQPVSVQVKKIEAKKYETPQYQLSSSQMKGKSRNWIGITTEYDTDLEWTDELTFTYYVLVENTKNQRGPRESLFKAKVTYANIEKGRGHKSDVYLHPSTLARYGDIKRIAVMVDVKGQIIAGDTLPSQGRNSPRWWEQLAPTEGMLLNRMQTPFAMVNFDDYEAVKQTGPQ